MSKRLLWLGSARRDIKAFPIYVLHAFEKRTKKTSGSDIELARARYRELLEHRRREGHEKG